MAKIECFPASFWPLSFLFGHGFQPVLVLGKLVLARFVLRGGQALVINFLSFERFPPTCILTFAFVVVPIDVRGFGAVVPVGVSQTFLVPLSFSDQVYRVASSLFVLPTKFASVSSCSCRAFRVGSTTTLFASNNSSLISVDDFRV